jgi:putative glycosyltransferase (TIGR04348 family)
LDGTRGTIGIVRPALLRARLGNRVTAARWASILRALGRRVFLEGSWSGRPCEALIVLHAVKSHDSIVRFREQTPDAALIVAATGTDLYRDAGPPPQMLESFRFADRIVVLQECALQALPPELRGRARVIHQSVELPGGLPSPAEGSFDACLVGHLRAVKDPLRAALAARLLSEGSRIRVLHLGRALDEELGEAATRESATNPRYVWLGERSRAEALAVMSRCRLALCTSWHEGGSNAVSEALALSLPVLSSRIPGSVGLLGEDHPGLYPPGDTEALCELMSRAETDPDFYRALERHGRERAWITEPGREKESWRELLAEVLPGAGTA